MSYTITNYTKGKARALGVTVKRSENKSKKIDVFLNGKKVASVGAIGYNDYPTYLKLEKRGVYPRGYADKRRKLYKQRHKSNRLKKGSNGYYADKLLW